jgi:hypothetical protein
MVTFTTSLGKKKRANHTRSTHYSGSMHCHYFVTPRSFLIWFLSSNNFTRLICEFREVYFFFFCKFKMLDVCFIYFWILVVCKHVIIGCVSKNLVKKKNMCVCCIFSLLLFYLMLNRWWKKRGKKDKKIKNLINQIL